MTKRPKAVVAVFAVLGLAAMSRLHEVRIDPSTEKYADRSNPGLSALHRERELFGVEDPILVALVGEDSVFTRDRLTSLRDLHAKLAAVPQIRRVWSLADAASISSEGDSLSVEPIIREAVAEEADFAEVRARARSNRTIARTLFSDDERIAFLYAFPEPRPEDPHHDHRVVHGVRDHLSRARGPDEILVGGRAVVFVAISESSLKDVLTFVPITALLLILMLAYIYRSLWAAVLPLGSALFVSMSVLGIQVHRGKALSEMDTMLPSMLTAVSVAYSMHLLDRYARADGSAQERVRQALRSVTTPVIVSTVTTMAGFLALSTTSSPAIREFTLFGVFGVGLMGCTALLLLPSLLLLVEPPLHVHDGRGVIRRFVRWAERATRQRDRWVIASFAVLIVLIVAGASRLRVDNSFVDWLPSTHDVRADYERLEALGVGSTPVDILLDAGGEGDALSPTTIKALHAVEARLADLPYVTTSLSLAGIVAELHRHMAEGKPDPIPASRELIAQYVLLYESSVFASELESLVDFERRYLRLTLGTTIGRSTEWARHQREIMLILEETAPNLRAEVTGFLPVLFESTDTLATDQLRSLMIALGAILLILMVSFRSPRWGFLALPANIIPIAAVFAVMGFAGISLDLLTSVIACLTLGIIVDDTVHFVVHFRNAYRRNDDLDQATRAAFSITSRPLTHTTLVLAGTFAVFALSGFPGIRNVGTLATTGIVVALFSDLLLLPVLLRRFARR